ncbi:hypothetical protein ACFL3V_02040 [Nanoarchaeota archaeon]
MIKNCIYTVIIAGALYVGAKTGGCDYVMNKAGIYGDARKKANESSEQYVKTIDSIAETAKDVIKQRR